MKIRILLAIAQISALLTALLYESGPLGYFVAWKRAEPVGGTSMLVDIDISKFYGPGPKNEQPVTREDLDQLFDLLGVFPRREPAAISTTSLINSVVSANLRRISLLAEGITRRRSESIVGAQLELATIMGLAQECLQQIDSSAAPTIDGEAAIQQLRLLEMYVSDLQQDTNKVGFRRRCDEMRKILTPAGSKS